ncbi:MAG: hypothetical protein J2P36_10600 [Ktedonobacteraceae bacterium]|nr:hypothetical protein [Ktedonobacteraceae bacterium]
MLWREGEAGRFVVGYDLAKPKTAFACETVTRPAALRVHAQAEAGQ